jgi:hypothetical protein
VSLPNINNLASKKEGTKQLCLELDDWDRRLKLKKKEQEFAKKSKKLISEEEEEKKGFFMVVGSP